MPRGLEDRSRTGACEREQQRGRVAGAGVGETTRAGVAVQTGCAKELP